MGNPLDGKGPIEGGETFDVHVGRARREQDFRLEDEAVAFDADVLAVLEEFAQAAEEVGSVALEFLDLARERGIDLRLVPCSATVRSDPALLERIVAEVPPPRGEPEAPLRALVFDAWFDPYVGVAALVRVVDDVDPEGFAGRGVPASDATHLAGLGRERTSRDGCVATLDQEPLGRIEDRQFAFVS